MMSSPNTPTGFILAGPFCENPMSTPFQNAGLAAREIVSSQSLPASTLYVVASPIGNLADITLRALHVLQVMDYVACEDTRHTQQLCRSLGIDLPASKCIAVHQHNEHEGAQRVASLLQEGCRVAYLSDAGTPGVSDPGAILTHEVQSRGFRVMPIPGVSSVTALLSVSGVVEPEHAGFVFVGFLSSKAPMRQSQIQAMGQEGRAQILLEAPHRIVATAKALAALGERPLTLGRELTKQFEEIVTLPCQVLESWLLGSSDRQRGEFALVVHPLKTKSAGESEDVAVDSRVLKLLLPHVPLKTAVALSAEITGQAKKPLYALALTLKSEDSSPNER